MKDLGEANFILDMKITKACDGIYLDQTHYVEKILRKYNFHNHKSVATPFDSSVHLFPVNKDRKSTRLNSSHLRTSRMPSSA